MPIYNSKRKGIVKDKISYLTITKFITLSILLNTSSTLPLYNSYVVFTKINVTTNHVPVGLGG